MNLFLLGLSLCLATPLLSASPAPCKWVEFREKAQALSSLVAGWHDLDKIHRIMEIVREERPRTCLEIGPLCGSCLLPIALALEYNRVGVLHCLNSWKLEDNMQGMDRADPCFQLWEGVDYSLLYKKVHRLLSWGKLKQHCVFDLRTPCEGMRAFSPESVDLIHMSADVREEENLRLLQGYLPKLRDGGLLVVTSRIARPLQQELFFLLERTSLSSAFDPDSRFWLFRRSKLCERSARQLLH